MKVEDRDFIQDINFPFTFIIWKKKIMYSVQWPDLLSCKKHHITLERLRLSLSIHITNYHDCNLPKQMMIPLKASDQTNLSNIKKMTSTPITICRNIFSFHNINGCRLLNGVMDRSESQIFF